MKAVFDHEKLRVYQASIDFIVRVQEIMNSTPKRYAVYDQLDRASTSIALNIAEGNGKLLPRDRCRFLDIARGSALECAAALDILVAKGILSKEQIEGDKQMLQEIVSMLIDLVKNFLPDRLGESQADYGEDCE
ncbi:MAG: four helix bundle protein [Thermodesulfobacteriota bacterium]|nr:four helix bundle protein [Thermodesulfobacteriota bacterium]